jgi:hypothetical protein
MTTIRVLAVTCVVTAACVAPVDYGDPRCVYGGHDEDGDCIWDKYDLCPTVPDLDQLNTTDNDAVGDACDPQLDEDNEALFYLGFGADDGPWPSDGDSWNPHAGALEVDRLGLSGAAYQPNQLQVPLLTIAKVRIDYAGPEGEVSLSTGYLADQGAGHECFVGNAPDQPGVLGWGPLNDGRRDDLQSTTVALDAPMADQGRLFELTVEHGYTRLGGVPAGTRCGYAPDGDDATVFAHDGNRPGPGALRLGVRDARVRVESVIVYSMVY